MNGEKSRQVIGPGLVGLETHQVPIDQRSDK